MIEEVVGAGRPLASSVVLEHAETAPPVLTHAVYRILQELLTNTQKHAPGSPVRVRVAGGPGRGIHIEVANPAPRPDDAGFASPRPRRRTVGTFRRRTVGTFRRRMGVCARRWEGRRREGPA
nr:hypothetical protein [Actinomycetales bacterium]